MKIEKVFSDFRGKHHFLFDDQKVYILEFPHLESLGARYEAAKMIADELWKSLVEEKKKKEEEAKTNLEAQAKPVEIKPEIKEILKDVKPV